MKRKFTSLIISLLLSYFGAQAQSSKNLPTDNSDPANRVVKLYPNPATSQINFEIQKNNEKSYDIIVFNFLGKKTDQLRNVSFHTTLNLDNYYNGVYIYQLRDVQGNLIESGKFNVIK